MKFFQGCWLAIERSKDLSLLHAFIVHGENTWIKWHPETNERNAEKKEPSRGIWRASSGSSGRNRNCRELQRAPRLRHRHHRCFCWSADADHKGAAKVGEGRGCACSPSRSLSTIRHPLRRPVLTPVTKERYSWSKLANRRERKRARQELNKLERSEGEEREIDRDGEG